MRTTRLRPYNRTCFNSHQISAAYSVQVYKVSSDDHQMSLTGKGSLPAATNLGQGNIFTGVCLSTAGVCLSACWDIPPSARPPSTRPSPGADTPPPGTRPPWAPPPCPCPPWHQTPPDQTPTPGKLTAAYGPRAAGTHPTGMHSCCIVKSQLQSGGRLVQWGPIHHG